MQLVRVSALLIAVVCLVPSAAIASCSTVGGDTTCAGTPGAAGSTQDGGDQAAPSPISGTLTSTNQTFVRGGDASTTNGGDGGDVTGAVVIDVNLALSSNDLFTYTAGGGWGGAATGGGAGGNGGDGPTSITATITGQAGNVTIGASGGDGGATATGTRGNGGSTGTIDAVVSGTFGSVSVVTVGGSLNGQTGTGGIAGNGGSVSLDFSGKAGQVYVQSAGGFQGYGAQPGQGGDVRVTLGGEVTFDLVLNNAGGLPGTVLVVLEDGAKVGGEIRNYNNTHGELQFDMQVSSQAELDAATDSIAAIGGNPNGTVTVAGQSYTFSGFSSLKNHISVLQAQNPGQPITVTFAGGSGASSAEVGSAFQPDRTRTAAIVAPRCRGRITPIVQPNGRIQLNGNPRDSKPLIVGWMEGRSFVPSAPNWSTVVTDERRGIKVEVIDPNGKLFATCRLPALAT